MINHLAVAAAANERHAVARDRDRRHSFRMGIVNGEIKLPVARRECPYRAVVPGCNKKNKIKTTDVYNDIYSVILMRANHNRANCRRKTYALQRSFE